MNNVNLQQFILEFQSNAFIRSPWDQIDTGFLIDNRRSLRTVIFKK